MKGVLIVSYNHITSGDPKPILNILQKVMAADIKLVIYLENYIKSYKSNEYRNIVAGLTEIIKNNPVVFKTDLGNYLRTIPSEKPIPIYYLHPNSLEQSLVESQNLHFIRCNYSDTDLFVLTLELILRLSKSPALTINIAKQEEEKVATVSCFSFFTCTSNKIQNNLEIKNDSNHSSNLNKVFETLSHELTGSSLRAINEKLRFLETVIDSEYIVPLLKPLLLSIEKATQKQPLSVAYIFLSKIAHLIPEPNKLKVLKVLYEKTKTSWNKDANILMQSLFSNDFPTGMMLLQNKCENILKESKPANPRESGVSAACLIFNYVKDKESQRNLLILFLNYLIAHPDLPTFGDFLDSDVNQLLVVDVYNILLQNLSLLGEYNLQEKLINQLSIILNDYSYFLEFDLCSMRTVKDLANEAKETDELFKSYTECMLRIDQRVIENTSRGNGFGNDFKYNITSFALANQNNSLEMYLFTKKTFLIYLSQHFFWSSSGEPVTDFKNLLSDMLKNGNEHIIDFSEFLYNSFSQCISISDSELFAVGLTHIIKNASSFNSKLQSQIAQGEKRLLIFTDEFKYEFIKMMNYLQAQEFSFKLSKSIIEITDTFQDHAYRKKVINLLKQTSNSEEFPLKDCLTAIEYNSCYRQERKNILSECSSRIFPIVLVDMIEDYLDYTPKFKM